MPSSADAVKTLGQAVNAAYNTAGITSKNHVFIGWPTSTKIADLFAKPETESLISLWRLKAKPCARFHPTSYALQAPVAGVTATLDDTKTILTIGGSPNAGETVHAFFGHPLADASHVVANGDDPNVIAAALAGSIEALGGAAVANANVVTLSAGAFNAVNVGAVVQMVREINRLERMVQVSVWCNDPVQRVAIADAISERVGGRDQPFLTAPDGSMIRCELCDDGLANDSAESEYNSFRSDLLFRLEYGITQSVTATQVAVTEFTPTLDDVASPIAIGDGL